MEENKAETTADLLRAFCRVFGIDADALAVVHLSVHLHRDEEPRIYFQVDGTTKDVVKAAKVLLEVLPKAMVTSKPRPVEGWPK